MTNQALRIQPTAANQLVSILWIDDEPENIEPFARLLEKEQKEVRISIASRLSEAEEAINEADHSAVIVDCKMNPLDRSENGATFLLAINEQNKALPTFVYSAFLDDPLYQEKIERSYSIAAKSKNASLERPVSQDHFFRSVLSCAKEYNAVSQLRPEMIEYREYIVRPEAYRNQTNAHWKKHRHWIQKDFSSKGYVWGIVCGDEVVNGSEVLDDFPDERALHEWGLNTNLIPFAYSASFPPESVDGETSSLPWSKTIFKEDHYPAISIELDGQRIIDDFDTGAYQTCVSDDLVELGPLSFFQFADGVHLEESHEYLTKKVRVGLVASDGTVRESKLPVRVVKSWYDSSFCKIKPERRVLIGRDFLRVFACEVRFNSLKKESQVHFLPATSNLPE